MRQRKILIALFVSACALRAQNFVNGQAARAVIGQTTFTNANATPSQQILGGVSGLAYVNGGLYVADSNRVAAAPQDHRVLLFNLANIPAPRADLTQNFIPITSTCYLCGYLAVNSLGQPTYTPPTPSGSTTPAFSPGRTNDPSQPQMSSPTAVASDGHVLAVADTDNNRVLLWTSMPTTMNQPANIVLGQTDFTSFRTPQTVTASSLRGPQGVWIQNGRLYVADTQNYRILIWNTIPTQNNQAADLVLGQSNFTTGTQAACNPTSATYTANASELCNPVSVTVSPDGTHLFVSDLGFNRVLIWNSIPTTNGQGANVVVGQPDMTGGAANNVNSCPNGSGSNGECNTSLNFPRYALSDGTRLFIADGGNDRVLIYNSIPTTNGAAADVVLGQPDFETDVETSESISIASTAIDNTGAVDLTPSPMSLAFDGTNLYVSDPYNQRVLVFTPADTPLPDYSVVNWASEIIRQEGVVTLGLVSTITANDTATITIQSTDYTYTEKADDTLDTIAQGLVNAINSSNSGAGDPNATAIFGGTGTGTVYLSSKGINLGYDTISLAASTSNSDDVTATASGGYLSSGTAATAAPGMLVEINGTNLSDVPAGAPLSAPQTNAIPTTLGGTQVYMDGIPSPIYRVSSTQIISQVPYIFTDRNSTSVYVRTVHADGSVTITNATPVYIAPANPGLFDAPAAANQPRPWPAYQAVHQPGNPTAVVSVDGSVNAGDIATITIAGVNYNYTVVATDTLASIRDGLISAINAAPDPNVVASRGGSFTRVVLTARAGGAAGTGISIAGSASTNADVTITAYTATTCCAVTPGTLITASNPAVPGEMISVSAAGLGIVTDPSGAAQGYQLTGYPYAGPLPNDAVNSVSATLGGSTAEVIFAELPQASFGQYTVQMVVPDTLTANAATQLYIAQNAYISNTVTIPVGNASQVGTGPTGSSPGSSVALSIDVPSANATLSGVANIGGWALDRSTTLSSVKIAVDGTSFGNAGYGGPRADVCAIYTDATDCPNVGWNAPLDTTRLANGTHTLTVTATGADGVNGTQAAVFTVSNDYSSSATHTYLDSPGVGNSSFQGVVTFSGWSLNDNSSISQVSVAVDGVPYGSAVYGVGRPDVCGVYTGRPGCPNVGWSFLLDTNKLANGSHNFAVTAVASDGTTTTVGNNFTVANWTNANPTTISIDSPNTQSAAFSGFTTFGGWAIDNAEPIVSVKLAVDGVSIGAATYGGERDDVCAIYTSRPGCPYVGWNMGVDTTQFSDGSHTLQVTAFPLGGQPFTMSSPFTVANLTGSNPMKLTIDTPNASSAAVSGVSQLAGWALSSNGAISSVQILIDGVSRGYATYGGSRPDVCAVYTGSAGCPNVGWNLFFDTTSLTNGAHTLEARATSTVGQTASTATSFTVANSTSAGPGHVFIDTPNSQNTPFVGLASFSGWALNDNAPITSVNITIDGVPYGNATYGGSRPDVCGAYPGRAGCPNVGWTFSLDTTRLPDGNHTLGITAVASGGGYTSAAVGFVVGNWSISNPMLISVDNPAPGRAPLAGTVVFGGWALENNVALATVQLFIDGVPYGPAAYGGNRSDVCTLYPSGGGCPNIGWSMVVDTTLLFNGTHTLAVTGTTVAGQTSTTTSTFSVAN